MLRTDKNAAMHISSLSHSVSLRGPNCQSGPQIQSSTNVSDATPPRTQSHCRQRTTTLPGKLSQYVCKLCSLTWHCDLLSRILEEKTASSQEPRLPGRRSSSDCVGTARRPQRSLPSPHQRARAYSSLLAGARSWIWALTRQPLQLHQQTNMPGIWQ